MRWNCRVPVGMHGGVRGRLSICENILFDCGIRQALQNLPNICIDADGLQLNFLWANCLPLVDADVGGVWVLGCHLPERVFDDNGRIVPNAQFQKEDFLPCAGPEKFSYRSTALCQPLSSTKVSSLRRFMVKGFPQWGQVGRSSVGIFISSCRLTISRMTSSLSKVS